MAGRNVLRHRSTGGGDTTRWITALEEIVSQLADDIERAFDVGGKWEIVRATTSITAKPWQWLLCNPTGAAFGVLLPDPTACSLAEVQVTNDSASTNAITLRVPNSGTVDGASTLVMNTARLSKRLRSDGREWKVL